VIYDNGEVEGFEEGVCIVNRYPLLALEDSKRKEAA
jgi:hypothetical protein